jgi:hypothetical protein
MYVVLPLTAISTIFNGSSKLIFFTFIQSPLRDSPTMDTGYWEGYWEPAAKAYPTFLRQPLIF